jgi:hypothetical protein
VDREIVVHPLHAGEPITAGQARQLARALIAVGRGCLPYMLMLRELYCYVAPPPHGKNMV